MLRRLFMLGFFCFCAHANAALVITLIGTPGSRDMTVIFSGSGWTSASGSGVKFSHGIGSTANSSDASLSGSTREQLVDFNVGDPFQDAINGAFTSGQYVAFDTPIAMTASASPNSFNVVGLHFDSNTGPSDDFSIVTDNPTTTTWASGTTFGYTDGVSATFSLNATINANFDAAFNQGTYVLDEDSVGSLVIVPEPSTYTALMAFFMTGLFFCRKFSHQVG